MFSGPDPAVQSIIRGTLAAAAGLYAVATIAIVIAVRAEPARARFYTRLAGVAKVGPFLVGLACLGLIMDAIDLRSGHEADVMTRWPELLPQVALLSAGAAFLAGLLAGARAIGTAAAAGGPIAILSALVWLVAGWFLLALEREKAGVVSELRQSAPAAFSSFFRYLTLFPVVAIVVSGAGASLGRLLHGLLGLSGDEGHGGRTPAAPTTAQAVMTASSLHVPAPPIPSPPAQPLPTPGPPAGDTAPAGRPRSPALAGTTISTSMWPSRVLMALGVLILIPAGCDLLRSKARISASEPAGGAVLSRVPSDVSLTFSDELSPLSKVTVRRTVSLDETGREEATGGTPVAQASGASALSVDRRTLRVHLPEGLPGGLYLVEWTTTRARGTGERYGDLYFGVRMKVPRFIRDGGVSRERDPYEQGRREALGGGVMAILIGLALRWYANALQGR